MIRDVADLLAELNAERQRRQLTVAEWCDKAGVSKFTYYRAVERGSAKVYTLALLGGALDLQLAFVSAEGRAS